MIKRTVLYARVSKDDRDNDGRNLASQIEMGREFAGKKGYQVVAELPENDRGASGAEIDLPMLNRIRDMAHAGEFDVLTVREIDRLSRNLAKQLIVEEELKKCGVEIEYVLGEYPDTPEGNFMKHVRASVAEFEREKITERMERRRRDKAKTGKVVGGGPPPYGYRFARNGDGKIVGLEVDEAEARVVRQIFEWLIFGNGDGVPLTFPAIAGRLSGDGVPTPSDNDRRRGGSCKRRARGEWDPGVPRQITRNEAYIGKWFFGKNHVHEARNGSKGDYKKHPLSRWILVTVPAIVSPELWKAAQARRIKNRHAGGRAPAHDYLVRQRAHCICGYAVSVVSHPEGYFYYRCGAVGHSGEFIGKCDQKMWKQSEVDTLVWGWVRGLVLEPEILMRRLEEAKTEDEATNAPLRNRLLVIDTLLASNRAQLARLLDLFLAGDFERDVLTDRKARLESTITSLERERADLAGILERSALTQAQVQTVTDFADQVRDRLPYADQHFEARRALIEALDLTVTLARDNNGRTVVFATCIIGKKELFIDVSSTCI